MLNRSAFVVILPVFILMSLLLAVITSNDTQSNGAVIFLIYLLALIISGVIIFAFAKLTYKFYKYELAQDAYHSEKGVIVKKYISIPYERIQNVDINRGILARVLGLSDIDIQTAGRSSGGFSSEGRLPGIDKDEAVKLRDELIRLAKSAKSGV